MESTTANTEEEDRDKRKPWGEKTVKIGFETLTGMRHRDERCRVTQTCIEMCMCVVKVCKLCVANA